MLNEIFINIYICVYNDTPRLMLQESSKSINKIIFAPVWVTGEKYPLKPRKKTKQYKQNT